MRRRINILIIFLAWIFITNAQEFEKQRFQGFITEYNKDSAIQYGAIKNTKTGEVALSDLEGSFSISGTVGDTLKFRCMGYKATEWVIPGIWTTMEDTIQLKVNANVYALEEVEVVRYYSYAHFKQAFKDLKLEKTDAEKAKENAISWDFQEAIAQGVADAKFGYGTFGVSIAINKSDKITEQRRAIAKLEKVADASAEFKSLTSADNVRSLTGYDGTCLDSFMVYLNSNYKLDYKMPQYDVLATIVAAADNFDFTKGDAPWYEKLVD